MNTAQFITVAVSTVALVLGVVFAVVTVLGRQVEIAIGSLREDMGSLRRELTAEMTSVRREVTAEMASVRRELTGQIDGLRGELTGQIDGLRGELTGHIDSLRGELTGHIDSLRSETRTGFQAVGQRFDDASRRTAALEQAS